jgi:hypothetical protein
MQGPQDQLDVNQLVLQIVLNLFVVVAAAQLQDIEAHQKPF